MTHKDWGSYENATDDREQAYGVRGRGLCLRLAAASPITADARTCLKIDHENSPTVTVSGRITTQHRVPKDSDLRAGDGPWLVAPRSPGRRPPARGQTEPSRSRLRAAGAGRRVSDADRSWRVG